MGLGLGLGLSKSGYTPFTLTSVDSLVLWLQNGIGVAAEKWNDSSGNGNHALQSDVNKRATVSGGGLDFERGDEDHYDLTSTITISTNGGFCFAAVITLETNANNTILGKDAFDQFQVRTVDEFRFRSDDSNVTTDFVFSTDGSTFPVSTKMLILLNRSAGASNRFSFFKNGTELTANTDTSSNEAAGENPGGFDLNVLGAKEGSSQFFDGIMHEVAFWNRSLTSTEIADVNSYLKNFHGL